MIVPRSTRNIFAILAVVLAGTTCGEIRADVTGSACSSTTDLDRLVCDDSWLAGLDREMAGQVAQLEKLSPKKSGAALAAGQREWLDKRTALCPTYGYEPTECLRRLYSQRATILNGRLATTVTFSCEGGRAALAFSRRADGTTAEELQGIAECSLPSGLSIRVARDEDSVTLWVDRRRLYSGGLGYPRRVEIGEQFVELCTANIHSDRDAGEMNCAPLANSHGSGDVDYLAFPPEAGLPAANSLIVAFQERGRDPDFCRSFIGTEGLALPAAFRPVPWEVAPETIFGKLQGEEWQGAIRFQIGGVDHAIVHSWRSEILLRRGESAVPRVVCRFIRAGHSL